ncbi:MAG: hypothetical protein P1U63_07720 [Coxiellaceae bacterium]|nr:hypothetical protein [Coxiellaceae bacterium]
MVSMQNVKDMQALQSKLQKLREASQAESKAVAGDGALVGQPAAEVHQSVAAECTRLLTLIDDWLQLDDVMFVRTPAGLTMPRDPFVIPSNSVQAKAYLAARAQDPIFEFKDLMQQGHALLFQQGWISRSNSDVVEVREKPVADMSSSKANKGGLFNCALRFICCSGGSKVSPDTDSDEGVGSEERLLAASKPK